jgi:hypothetical protein
MKRFSASAKHPISKKFVTEFVRSLDTDKYREVPQFVAPEELDALPCSESSIMKLGNLKLQLWRGLTTIMADHHAWCLRMGPRLRSDVAALWTFAAGNLLFYADEADVALKDELKNLSDLINDLEDKQPGLVGRAFFRVLFHPKVSMQRMWIEWERQYALIQNKAKEFKKICNSHRNRVRGFAELPDELVRRIDADYDSLFALLYSIIDENDVKQKNEEFGLRGKDRRSHPLWTEVMKPWRPP